MWKIDTAHAMKPLLRVGSNVAQVASGEPGISTFVNRRSYLYDRT
jgi:hypothetical protein